MEGTYLPNIVELIEGYGIELKKQGSEYIGFCPNHEDTKPSLMVNPVKNIYRCFACGFGGGYKKFIEYMGDTPPKILGIKKYVPQEVEVLMPVPKDMVSSPSFEHYKHGRPDQVYTYLGVNKELLGFVCRFNLPDGKQTLPYVYYRKDGQEQWGFKGFPSPRPLYGMERLKKAKSILFVEGEKARDYVAARLQEICVLSWPGGAMSVNKAKWNMIKNKNVYLWPDNDKPGSEAMDAVYEELKENNTLYRVDLPVGVPLHWDVADSGWNAQQIRDYLNSNSGNLYTIHK